MDIRNFFSLAGGSKKSSAVYKSPPAPPPAAAKAIKTHNTKSKNASRSRETKTKRSAPTQKSKPAAKPSIIKDESDDDDVEIIADSEDEEFSSKTLTGKKSSGFGKTYSKTNGKTNAGKTNDKKTDTSKTSGGKTESKVNGKDTRPPPPPLTKSKKAADEESDGKKSQKQQTPEAKSKKSSSAPTPPPAKTDKKRNSNKSQKISSDSDDDGEENKKPSNRNGSRKSKAVVVSDDAEEEEEDFSPIKRSASSRSKRRRVQELSDSDDDDDDVDGDRPKSKRGPKRNRLNSPEGKESKVKGSRILDSDSDREEEEKVPKKRGRRKKKEAVVVGSSDEEGGSGKVRGAMDSFVVHTPTAAKPQTQPSKPAQHTTKQASISAADFFGAATVHRKDTKPTPTPPAKRPVQSVDEELHDDDDFTATLQEMDRQQAKKPRRDSTPKKEKTDQEEEDKGSPSSSSSLASKLSARMKTTTSSSSSPAAAKTSPVARDDNSNVLPDSAKSPKKGSSGKTSPGKGVGRMEVTKKASPEGKKGSTTTTTPPKAADKASPPAQHSTTPASKSPKEETDKGSAKRNWAGYRSFLNREGPRALGSKEIPEGGENCLEGLTFVITGVLESLERDEAKSLVERYGGKVTGSVSSRTSYVVLGRDPGQSKINKAEQFKTKQLDEDGLLDLIRTLPGKTSKYAHQAQQALKKEQSLHKADSGQFTSLKSSDSRVGSSSSDTTSATATQSADTDTGLGGGGGGDSLMWVDKHKPGSLKQIVGQQGDKSNARKLLTWLQKWHKNRAAGVKPSGRFYGQDDGSGFRAALLSGPPGIGKTTTAVLVCKEAGFSTVELNASDKRSKRSLKEDVAEALHNMTLVDYMGDGKDKAKGQDTRGRHHCLIMDEVDGMAGNEDRGGLQELVSLIKATAIPIITICNDRNSMKMRTLANHCLDLRFQRPRLEQIKGALMSIAYKEGLKISPPALQEIILSSNQDIRQCIHNLSMWTANNKELSYDQAKLDAKQAQKDLKLGIFDVSRKIFAGGEETAKMTLNDKSDLFFQDYSFVPLFVHENYTSVTPYAARGDKAMHLSLLARAAESISAGDLVDRQVRGNGNWNLLPTQAMYASVIPGEYMRGAVSHMIQFPQWLGKNSTTTKNDRVLQELRTHMALKVSCDKRGLNQDYLPVLRSRLTTPLVTSGSAGVSEVIQLMDDYDITKDDYDNIVDISRWPNSKDPLASLDSKTKAAFTRQYNKEGHMTPYATGVAPKKKRGRGGAAGAAEEDLAMEEGEGEGAVAPPASDSEKEDDDNDLERDSMIKVRKPSAAGSKGKAAGKGKAADTGKGGKGGNTGKGKGKAKR